ncbi:hypothetical protein EFBL_2509 [Effusibacillus lacus]|uniref:Prepilin-type N-terminal cleavage/methylation domain-containing protein n=2 Tax=Effusibacillus lacus TaxID=1348429 RepID=A0A292YIH7_9BACL|nr:hypothetical protein EFBL_2509 [Effusibacillus lacus]
MTLIEMLVGVVVLSLLILTVTGWFHLWNQTAGLVENSVRARVQTETALRILREDFRNATEVLTTGSELVFRNGERERIRYSMSEHGNLIRSLEGRGASVAATNIVNWHVERYGHEGVLVTFRLERSGRQWEKKVVLARRGLYEE